MSVFSVAGSTPSDTGFEIKSARFAAGSSTKLTRTPAVAGNRRTWTISCWFKWCIETQTYTQFFDGGGAGSAGASGVVILRVPTSSYSGTTSGSPTVTTSGSDKVLVFNGSGSYTT